jgi:hypothetical protein
MVHTFTQSPSDVRPPGYEYFAGTHFNPQITRWEQAHAFTGYINRRQFLLQQGLFTADVCYYQGDQISVFVLTKNIDPDLGFGYDYDVVNSEVILELMSVKNGKLTLPDGMQYKLMVLPDTKIINPQVLEKIEALVKGGATVVGQKPQKAYGLQNYPQCDSNVTDIADRLWGPCNGQTIKENAYGKGRIIWGKTPREVLLADGILPDFEYKSNGSDSEVDYIHRTIQHQSDKIDIYFIANFRDRPEDLECKFHVENKAPEIWNPESGEIKDLSIYNEINGQITCLLSLPPHGSAFVVFRKKSPDNYITGISRGSVSLFPLTNKPERGYFPLDIEFLGEKKIQVKSSESGQYTMAFKNGKNIDIEFTGISESHVIKNPWVLKFPPGWGAPDSIMVPKLMSWTEFSDPGIKYFFGTATYSTTFNLPDTSLQIDGEYSLDLGIVKDIAEISVNRQNVPVQWKPPYRVNITSFLTTGLNHITVKVTNLWPNRLIGDQFLPPEERFTFTNIGKFTRESSLLESGLIGPVKILKYKKIIIGL